MEVSPIPTTCNSLARSVSSIRCCPTRDMTDECHVGDRIRTTPEERHYGDLHASTFWDKFYKRNSTNFYKDRHYLHKVFPGIGEWLFYDAGMGSLHDSFPFIPFRAPKWHISSDPLTHLHQCTQAGDRYLHAHHPPVHSGRVLLEIGCGVGNSIFPLVEMDPKLRVFALDFSKKAIELLQVRMR